MPNELSGTVAITGNPGSVIPAGSVFAGSVFHQGNLQLESRVEVRIPTIRRVEVPLLEVSVVS
jgi:hypothetical protein